MLRKNNKYLHTLEQRLSESVLENEKLRTRLKQVKALLREFRQSKIDCLDKKTKEKNPDN